MYAVIRTGSKQYRVAPGDTIKVERMPGKVGGKITFDQVLAVRSDDQLLTGADAAKATVTGKIIEQGRHQSKSDEVSQDQAVQDPYRPPAGLHRRRGQ